MQAASGFVCYFKCGYPVPTTLYLTDSLLGSCTLTYSSLTGAWTGQISYSYPGCSNTFIPVTQSCPAVTINVSYKFTESTDYLEITYPAAVTTYCPQVGGGAAPPFDSDFVLPSSCTPFSWTGTITISSEGLYAKILYCPNTGVVTYTITT